MGRILKPMVRGGGWYPSKKWIPLVRNGGYTTQNGGETEPVWATVSGAIASFTTPFAYPLKKLVAQINPVQDLHGYDAPWPAGGGTNKLPPMVDGTYSGCGITIVVKDGVATFSGTATETGNIAVIPLLTSFTITQSMVDDGFYYHLNNSFVTSNLVPTLEDNSHVVAVSASLSATNRIIQLTSSYVDKPITQIRFYVYSGSATNGVYAPALVKSSVVTPYAPYSNECPISGHTGLEGQRTGANVFGGEKFRDAILAAVSSSTTGTDATGKYVTVAASAAANDKTILEMPFKENTQYTFIIKAQKSNANSATNLAIDYTDGTVGYVSFPSGISADTVYTFVVTTAANKTVKRIYTIWGSGTAYFYYENTGLFEGVLTADDFVPYTGEPISVSFGQTVYGGTDEVISGNGTSTMGMIDLGSLDWTLAYDRFNAQLPNIKPSSGQSNKPNILCSSYPTITPNEWYAKTLGITSLINGYIGEGYVGLIDPAYSDAASLKTALSGVMLCYELATPTTFTHDPQEVDTLVGQNNIWTTTGDVEVTYRIE